MVELTDMATDQSLRKYIEVTNSQAMFEGSMDLMLNAMKRQLEEVVEDEGGLFEKYKAEFNWVAVESHIVRVMREWLTEGEVISAIAWHSTPEAQSLLAKGPAMQKSIHESLSALATNIIHRIMPER